MDYMIPYTMDLDNAYGILSEVLEWAELLTLCLRAVCATISKLKTRWPSLEEARLYISVTVSA